MNSALGAFFEQQRKAKAISLGQLPSALAYRNENKARRRWADLVEAGSCSTEFLWKAAAAFGISSETINRLIEADIGAWERWADEPVKPYLVIRIIAAVYSYSPLPDGVTLEEAEALASAKAKEKGFRVFLVWNRRLSVHFTVTGEVDGRFNSTPWFDGRPYMSIKGRRFLMSSAEPVHQEDKP